MIFYIVLRIYFFFLSFTLSVLTFAQARTITKAKEDFAAAKFEEGLTRLSGLSKDANEQTLFYFYKAVYFYASSNPNYQLDSAYSCVKRSEELFLTISLKDRTEFCTDFSICMPRFAVLKDSLTNEIYTDLARKKDLAGFKKFCAVYPDSKAFNLAQQKIEELSFEQAIAANDLNLLEQFLKDFPQSKLTPQVNALREKISYESALKVNVISVYKQFLSDFKNAKNKPDVLRRIEDLSYANAKAAHSLAIYKDFLTEFPTSKYKPEIEGLVYDLRFETVSAINDIPSIEAFLAEFPNGTRNEVLLQKLADKYYDRAKASPTLANLEAYCTKFSTPSPRYTELHQMLEKLSFDNAVASQTKEAWLKFMTQFPNSSLIPEARIALADLFTIAPYLKSNGRMEYRDLQTNTPQFSKDFDFAMPFENGRAIIQDNGLFGVIDEQGKILVTAYYDQMESYFNNQLIVGSKLKPELVAYWQKNTDDIYNDEWSKADVLALKNHLSTKTIYSADTPAAQAAYRRYLGALVTREYYSYADFSYDGDEDEDFQELLEKAADAYNAMDYTIHLYTKGPFVTKKVEVYAIFDSYSYLYDEAHFTYRLSGKNHIVEYNNGVFIDRGTEDHLTLLETPDVRLIQDGFIETEETYNPGNFYLESKDGVQMTKQSYNAMEPLDAQGNYFLCHQGGTYEPFRGMVWQTIGGKWGVINKAGQVVLPLIFDELHAVDSFEVYPYLVSTINKVFPTEYNDYKETLGNVGLINLDGKELIPYADGYNMMEFINPQTIIVTKNAVIGYYANGMTEGSFALGGMAGVVNLQRKIILPVEFNYIQPINNANQFVVRKGMKLIASKDYSDEYTPVGGKYSLVNRSNQYLIPTPIDYLSTSLVGCVGCAVSTFDEAFNGKWGIVNELGKAIVPFTYSDAMPSPLDGVCTVNSGRTYKKDEFGFEEVTKGKWALVRNGTLMTPMKYNEIYVDENYIQADLENSSDFYQPNCQPVPFKCDDIITIDNQDEGKTALLAYRVGAKWGLVNTKFEKITEPIFWGEIDGERNQHPFTPSKGYFMVDQGGMKFYVTRKGRVLKDGLN